MVDNAPPAGAAAAIQFASVPGDVDGVIDYSTRQGLAIYHQATKSLYLDPADMYNVESSGLQTFLALLRHRGTTCGWDFDIPQDNDNPLNDLMDLTTFHGRFPMEHVRAFAATLSTLKLGLHK